MSMDYLKGRFYTIRFKMAEKMMLCGSIKSLNEVVLDRYIAEEKFDGERIMVLKKGKEVTLLNRRGRFKEDVYIELKEELQTLDFDFIIDGEVCSTNGLFNDLQKRALLQDAQKIAERRDSIPIIFHIFDIVELNGNNLTLEPLMKRKNILEDKFLNLKTAEVCSYFQGAEEINDLWKYVVENKKEGIILKIKDSIYQFKRSNSWLKMKNFKEIEIEFNKYELNNAGVKITNGFHEVQVQGIPRANWIIEKMNKGEGVKVIVQYLEKLEPSGKLRFPSCKEVVGYD
jgi:ATP-dependent DNA ligase